MTVTSRSISVFRNGVEAGGVVDRSDAVLIAVATFVLVGVFAGEVVTRIDTTTMPPSVPRAAGSVAALGVIGWECVVWE